MAQQVDTAVQGKPGDDVAPADQLNSIEEMFKEFNGGNNNKPAESDDVDDPFGLMGKPAGQNQNNPEGKDNKPAGQAPDQVVALQTELATVKSQLAQVLQALSNQPNAGQQQQQQQQQQQAPATIFDEATAENMLKDKKVFAETLNKILVSQQETMLRNLPEILEKAVNRRLGQEELKNSFWTENAELRDYKDFVGYVANQIAATNPTLDPKQILAQAAEKVRVQLKIEKQANQQQQQQQQNQGPAFAGNGRNSNRGSGTGRDTRTETQKGIDDLLAFA